MTSGRRGFLAIVGGTAVAQALTVIAAPILSRIYSPAEFGVFSVTLALAMTLAPLSSTRLELAVPLPRSDEQAGVLVARGVGRALRFAVVGTALAASLVVLARVSSTLTPQSWLVTVPALASCLAVLAVYNAAAIRQAAYTLIARRNASIVFIGVGLQLLLGLAGAGVAGLILGFVVGQIAGVLLIRHGLPRTPTPRPDTASAGDDYRRFAVLMSLAGLMNVVGLQAPLVLAGYLYDNEAAGHLGMALRVMALPVALIGQAAAQVFLGELAALKRHRSKAYPLFVRASRRLALTAVVLGIAIAVLAPWAFAFALGEEWKVSGQMAQALAIAVALQLIASPLSQTLVVANRPGLQMSWDLGRLLLVIGSFTTAHAMGANPVDAVWAVSGASALSYAASWVLSWRVLRRIS